MRDHTATLALVLTILVMLTLSTGIAATQRSQSTTVLRQLEEVVATTLGQLAVIIFLVGMAIWVIARKSTDAPGE